MSFGLVVAEDNLLVREGLRNLLELRDNVTVLATCSDYGAMLEAIDSTAFDVLVTDDLLRARC